MSSIKEAFLNIKRSPVQEIDVPELGTKAYLKKITLGERCKFSEAKDLETIYKLTLSSCLCDENGNTLFTTKEAETLLNQEYDVMERICKQASAYNGVNVDAATEAAKNV